MFVSIGRIVIGTKEITMDLNSSYFKALIGRADEVDESQKTIKKIWSEIEGKDLSETEAREKLEAPYLSVLDIQYQTARLFSPMTKFGRLALESARATHTEFKERTGGSLTTIITEKNIESFRPLMTDNVAEDILTERVKAIGALRYHEGSVYGVGVLTYRLEADRFMEGQMLSIEWLFVATAFREKRVATMLLGEIIDKCIANKIDHIIIDYPEDSHFAQAFYNMLSDWHFSFEIGVSPEFITKVTAENENSALPKMAEQAKPIGGYSKLRELMSEIAKSDKSLRKLLERKHPDDYFDPNISCFIYDKDKRGGLLLAHRLPDGFVRCEYLGWTKGGGDTLKGLISFFAVKVREVYGDGTLISLPVESTELSTFLDEYFDEHLGISTIEASLSSFLEGDDIDLATAMQILVEFLTQGQSH